MKIAAIVLFPHQIKKEELFFCNLYLPTEIFKKLKMIPEIEEIFMAAPAAFDGEIPQGCKKIILGDEGELIFLKNFFMNADFDHAVLVHVDCPFLDADILREMLQIHTTYLPEFTYSENVPLGFCGEIVSKVIFESVPEDAQSNISLSGLIKSNLHKFDVEIYYSHPDIRDKRISFRSLNVREKRIMERIIECYGTIPKYKEIHEVFQKYPQVLYVAPSYVEVEITGHCDLDCIFCFRKSLSSEHKDMEVEVFKKVVDDMRAFELPYHICIGGSGEPLKHPHAYKMMDLALAEKNVESVVVETNGILADANFATFAAKANGKLRIIVNLNGIDEKSYQAIHGGDYFRTVVANVERLRDALKGKDALYVQIMKINETESFLDKFYDMWEQKGIPIILQKQNTFLGRIQDRRYSDLSPLERIPCWHLQRDLYILFDGTVCFCKQDVEGQFARGNVKNESLKEIFQKGLPHFIENLKGNYPANPNCAICDEWYTFNL